jgi:hypothetical protein
MGAGQGGPRFPLPGSCMLIGTGRLCSWCHSEPCFQGASLTAVAPPSPVSLLTFVFDSLLC